jgi:hypothetical protein
MKFQKRTKRTDSLGSKWQLNTGFNWYHPDDDWMDNVKYPKIYQTFGPRCPDRKGSRVRWRCASDPDGIGTALEFAAC